MGLRDGVKRHRRKNCDPSGCSHICGCGRGYHSYPALYTHVRNKHQGVLMPGSVCVSSRVHLSQERPSLFSPSEQLLELEVSALLRYLPTAAPHTPSTPFEADVREVARRVGSLATFPLSPTASLVVAFAAYLRWLHSRVSSVFFSESVILALMLLRVVDEVDGLPTEINNFVGEGFPQALARLHAECPATELHVLGRTEGQVRALLCILRLVGAWLFATGRAAYRLEPRLES